MLIVAIISIAVGVILASGRKRLRRRMIEEYGDNSDADIDS